MARVLAVWCPDWPVVAAGVPSTGLVAVIEAGRVLACSPSARAEGVRPGLRRRQAQACCPGLGLIAHDPDRDARAFEPVLAALESLTPRIEVLRPGACAFPVRGAARYHGGEASLTAVVTAAVDRVPGLTGCCRIGIADGRFAAGLAARHARADQPTAGERHRVVPPGETPGFLAPFAVEVLERPELTDLLVRLGLHTLGDLAVLPRAVMAARFGPEGIRAHRLASGLDEHSRSTRCAPPELEVVAELDPPATTIDAAGFAAKALADELVDRLERLGLACTRLRIEVETEHGEALARVWRHEPPARPSRRGAVADPHALQVASIVERVRWQLDGWLAGSAAARPTGPITRLALIPDEAVAARGRQLGFWGGETEAGRRAARALARVQGLLGPEAVRRVSLRGGRGPADRVVSVAEGEIPEPSVAPGAPARPAARSGGAGRAARPGPRGPAGASGSKAAPWPGRIPEPSPAIVHPDPVPVEVKDAEGASVTVSGRGRLSAEPGWLGVSGGTWVRVVAWAGPWPVDERWWDPTERQRLARLQVTGQEEVAYLLKLVDGHWWIEATYD